MIIDLTIIIPVYHVDPAVFRRCIQSIMRQKLGDIRYEILVIVDGEDENRQLLESHILQNMPCLRFIVVPHNGEAVARNLGIQHAKGKWFLFVDADDCLEDNAIFNLMTSAICSCKIQPVDLVVSNHIRVTGKTYVPIIYYKNRRQWVDNGVDFLADVLSVGSDQGTVWSKLFRTAFVRQCQVLFNSQLVNGVDQEFMTRLVLHSPVVCSIPQITYRYIYNPESVVRKFDPHYDKQIFLTLSLIQKDITNAGLALKFRKTYADYCCDRLLLLIMNYICNPNSGWKYLERKKEFLRIIQKEPIAGALRSSDYGRMSFARRLVMKFASKKMFAMIDTIARIRNFQRSMQLK